jgi:hypothetical protein
MLIRTVVYEVGLARQRRRSGPWGLAGLVLRGSLPGLVLASDSPRLGACKLATT